MNPKDEERVYILHFDRWLSFLISIDGSNHSYLLLLVEVCKNRKSAFASELGASDYDGFTGCNGYV